MGKKRSPPSKATSPGPGLFTAFGNRRRRVLILPRLLAEEAASQIYRGKKQDQAHEVLKRWADLETQGHLARKETALDADFLFQVFGAALGWTPATQSPEHYHLERNFAVPGVGTADGALGNFSAAGPASPIAVIELKDAGTDLDRDKFAGRTPVQQCWDYLNALPDCPWGIVSNFVTFRLYHRNKTPLAYQEFHLQDLRDIDVFRQFWCLFEFGGLLPSPVSDTPRAVRLLEKTENRQREVSDVLYEQYRANRYRLIEHLHYERKKPLELAIRIAQKILDRIIFIAFCEDRNLLPARSIEAAYRNLPPFAKATNPRWQNFLNLFEAVDKGHAEHLMLDKGCNGGLFRHDPEVDELQLDDSFTNFFHVVGGYDFRDEVNVEVLGHMFEKSVGELEQLRLVGLFAPPGAAAPHNGTLPAMTKSAERKRFGIYYTPPDFTEYIVQHTVGAVVEQRLEEVRQKHQLAPEQLEPTKRSPKLAEFWHDSLQALRQIKVCDPACGSGAFLIQAYDLLEEKYSTIADNLRFHDGPIADEVSATIPDTILGDNLFGVDLSEPAVEITQLALWIRSARLGQTLADLSRNIIWGNSLVTDPKVVWGRESVDDPARHPRAVVWEEVFPAVFQRPNPGFDCVIGNPPWERLKLQEREFFAFSAPKIAGAVSADRRRKLIVELERTNPNLYARYVQAKESAERTAGHVRASGRFPLTAKGDVNTYMLFAELGRRIVAASGRVGFLVPSGIATDNTTRHFFGDLMEGKALVSLHDFENKAPVFPDVHRSFKFCTLVYGGATIKVPAADFVFFARQMDDLNDKKRHIPLSTKDISLLNPNSRTCPIFRSKRDANLTKAIYRRVPILIDENREEGGNPWGIDYLTMFHQTNDAELFRTAEQMRELGFRQAGNRWKKGKQTFLPLYEAKMIQAYDHRAASVIVASANWMRQGQTEATPPAFHQNPEFVVQPRWWVEDKELERVLASKTRPAYLAFKDVTSPTNQRTMIAALVPHAALVNSAPLMLTGEQVRPRQLCCLLANLNSLALDFVARQKVGGVHLNFFIVNQLPIFAPDHYAQRYPWTKRQTLEKWISDRVLKLTCTANDMKPLAAAASFDPPIHKWNEAERAELLNELDAAFFLLYGMDRDDAEYILTTFRGLGGEEEESPGMFPQAASILEVYDRLAKAE